MLYLQLFLTFLKIGAFTFGGGYAMISLIQHEVVVNHQWLTSQEFTDILAISQATPGPIGINTATYTGYTAILSAGYSPLQAVMGAIVASGAVILVPVFLMLLVAKFLSTHSANSDINNIFRMLRIAVIGLIAAAALSLFNTDTFGSPGINLHFLVSCAIFVVVFALSLLPNRKLSLGGRTLNLRPSPITLLLLSGTAGFLVYFVF